MGPTGTPRLGYYLLFGGILGFGTLTGGDPGLLVLDAALAGAGLLLVLRGLRAVRDAGLRRRLLGVDALGLLAVLGLSLLLPVDLGLVKALIVAVPAVACILRRERLIAGAEAVTA